MRGIQHAAASRLYNCCLWDTGSPAFAGDDAAVWEDEKRYAAFTFFVSWIARHTRSGVKGMLMCLMP